MPIFKLNITYNIDAEDEGFAVAVARELILGTRSYVCLEPVIALNREADRSGANILFRTSDSKHFRNQKVPISEYPGYSDCQRTYDEDDIREGEV